MGSSTGHTSARRAASSSRCPTTPCSTARPRAATSTPARRCGCAATTSISRAWVPSDRFEVSLLSAVQQGGDEMAEHTIGTREKGQPPRNELAKLEAEQAERNREVHEKRLALPWVPVEKQYECDTEDGKKTLAELFDGRSQLLAYNVMFGPDYTLGACPGCSSLADGLNGSLVHLNHSDVTLLCFSRAPIDRLAAYKERMGWEVPYLLPYNSDFAFDFGLALREQQAQEIPELKGMIDDPPDWLEEWSGQIGADLEDGLRENPAWNTFPGGDGAGHPPHP